MSEKRIYVVVAKSVQNPIRRQQVPSKTRWLVVPGSETKTIIQPPGRIAAQVAHVVSRMRLEPRVRYIFEADPITTIILSVPDRYQLLFTRYLFEQAGIPVHSFLDTNEEYGPGPVETAICTEPVLPTDVEGVLDYLPLWDGKP